MTSSRGTGSAVLYAIRAAGKKATAAEVDVCDFTAVNRLVETAVGVHGRLDYMFNKTARPFRPSSVCGNGHWWSASAHLNPAKTPTPSS